MKVYVRQRIPPADNIFQVPETPESARAQKASHRAAGLAQGAGRSYNGGGV
ncbi:MAG: hypothetical protein RMI94_14935 [Bryobacterales bacterium]|nr:hypothetical protein [Bryobacteraceae bacterium]MDW8131845.1 hypothetical protein [Bryobacterales bacterium]